MKLKIHARSPLAPMLWGHLAALLDVARLAKAEDGDLSNPVKYDSEGAQKMEFIVYVDGRVHVSWEG